MEATRGNGYAPAWGSLVIMMMMMMMMKMMMMMMGRVSTWMGDRLQADKPSRYVTSHLGMSQVT